MKYKAVTVSREYGSGGAEIAGILAKKLNWRLVDQALLAEISEQAKVPLSEAATLDERVDPWLHRIMRPVWSAGADGVSLASAVDVFDADAMAQATCAVVESAYREGSCVIVGRGSQCILRLKPDVFHVFIYANLADRLRRVRARVAPDADANRLIADADHQRQEYVRRHFGQNRLDPRLYDLMINSQNGPEITAQLVLAAMIAS